MIKFLLSSPQLIKNELCKKTILIVVALTYMTNSKSKKYNRDYCG